MPYSKDGKMIAWWSAGVTSAVACKIAIETYGKENVIPIYFKIDSAHKDNQRFLEECEDWYGKKIIQMCSETYKDQFDVIKKTRYINGPSGARCTLELKKKLRFKVEKEFDYGGQIFGFEFQKKEVNRALRFLEQYPDAAGRFPLIEKGIDKQECLFFLEKVGIDIPAMYTMGYPNNNCIGCVKGGAGYWNKIRKDFPEHFNKMSELEEEIGATCLKDKNGRIPLKDLDPERGRKLRIVMPDCGNFCEIEFAEIPHQDSQNTLNNPLNIKSYYKGEVNYG